MTMDWSPVWISLRTAVLAGVCAFAFGLLAAKGVHSLPKSWLRALLDGLFTLPMVLPPTAAGFFLLMVFGVKRPVGQFLLQYFGVKIAFSWEATVLAAFVISFPLMYRAARGALEQVDPMLLDAARTLGRREGWIFWRVELPLALPGVMAGGALAFARGLGEFGATAMIAGNILGKTRTLPLAVASAVAAGDMKAAMGYVWILLLISLLVVLSMGVFTARGRRFLRGEDG